MRLVDSLAINVIVALTWKNLRRSSHLMHFLIAFGAFSGILELKDGLNQQVMVRFLHRAFCLSTEKSQMRPILPLVHCSYLKSTVQFFC